VPIQYETDCLRFTVGDHGKLTIASNGLVPKGEWDWEEVEQILSRLSQEGWHLISFVDRTPYGCRSKTIELFFQRQIPQDSVE